MAPACLIANALLIIVCSLGRFWSDWLFAFTQIAWAYAGHMLFYPRFTKRWPI